MIIMESILESARDLLRANLSDITEINKSIRVTIDEKTPPYAGEEFIAIYGDEVINTYRADWIERRLVYSITIAVTRRLSGIPIDQQGETIYTYDEAFFSRNKSSLIERMSEVINFIDGNQALTDAIKAKLPTSNICVVTNLGLMNMDGAPTEVDNAHFNIFDVEEDTNRPIGLVMEATFGGLSTYQMKIGVTP